MTTLTVEEDSIVPGRYNVSGDDLTFTVAVSPTAGRIDVTGDGKVVEVEMDETYPTRANIRWLGWELGWRTSPTDSLQTESRTYLPTAADPDDMVTSGVDYSSATDSVSEFTEKVHTIPSDVLTSNRAADRIYAYYLYPVRVSAYVAKTYARRVHFTVSGTTVSKTADQVDLDGWYVAWICKDDDDDNILYAATATYKLTINFDEETVDSEEIDVTAGYIFSEQRGKYVYFVYRTITGTTDFSITYSYERLNIQTGEVTSVSLGSVSIPGSVSNFTRINYTYKTRVGDGIMLLEWYIADGQELGVIYVTDGASKSVQWTKIGADTIDYYHALGQDAPAGFTGNSGTTTHLLGFINAWSSSRYYCGYAHLDDDAGLTVSLFDIAYDDLELPSMTNMTNNFIVCSSRYVDDPYFIDLEGTDIVIRSGLDGSVYTTLDPADYDCSALYPSWEYLSDSGISGNYTSLGGNTRDDIDDSIYIHGKRTSDGLIGIFGIDEDGNQIKYMDLQGVILRSASYGFVSKSSTSQSMMVDTRYEKDKNSNWTFTRWVRYIYPWAPDYTR